MVYISFTVGTRWNNLDLTGQWFNYSAGIWMYDIDGVYTELNNSGYETFKTINIVDISSVLSDNLPLDKVASIADLSSQAGFFWDNQDKRVYIRLSNFESPDYHNINIGVSKYVSTTPYVDSTGNIAIPKLISLDTISTDRPPVTQNNTIKFDQFGFSISNADGEYDDFNEWDIYKQPVTARYVNEVTGKNRTIYNGVIGGYTIDNNQLKVDTFDIRKGLDDNVIQSYFNKTDYPNLDDNDAYKPIPIRYGNLRRVKPICVNRGSYDPAASQTLTFKVADTSIHNICGIDAFYIDGVAKTIASSSLTAGTFTYSKGAGVEVDFDKCQVDMRGYCDSLGNLITNPADIVKDLILIMTGEIYNSTNYNTSRWVEVRSLMSSGYLDIDKETKLIDAIQLALQQNVAFIITNDGKYSLSKQDYTKVPSYTIPKEHILNLTALQEQYNTADIYSSVKVKYANGLSFIDSTNEQTIFDKYRTKNILEYESTLSTATDAEDLAGEIVLITGELRPVYSLVLPMELYCDIELDDIISVQIDRIGSTWRGYVDCIIEGWSIDALSDKITVKARSIGQTNVVPFAYGQTELLGAQLLGSGMLGGINYTR